MASGIMYVNCMTEIQTAAHCQMANIIIIPCSTGTHISGMQCSGIAVLQQWQYCNLLRTKYRTLTSCYIHQVLYSGGPDKPGWYCIDGGSCTTAFSQKLCSVRIRRAWAAQCASSYEPVVWWAQRTGSSIRTVGSPLNMTLRSLFGYICRSLMYKHIISHVAPL